MGYFKFEPNMGTRQMILFYNTQTQKEHISENLVKCVQILSFFWCSKLKELTK